MHPKQLVSVFIFLPLVLSACTKPSPDRLIEINNAYVPVRGESQMHFAAYFELANNGPQAITLRSATSEQFKSASLHVTSFDKGMSRMRPLHGVEIKSGETVSFEPNGKHLMLMQATESIAAREAINVQLQFTDGTVLDQSIPIRKQSK